MKSHPSPCFADLCDMKPAICVTEGPQIISMIRPSAFTNISGYMAAWWQLHRKMVAADLCDMDLAIRVTEVHEITSMPLFR